MLKNKLASKFDDKNIIKMYYAFFLAWFFATIHNESITDTISQTIYLDNSALILLIYFLTLSLTGFVIKKGILAKKLIVMSSFICLFSSLGLFASVHFIKISTLLISVSAGVAVSSFGYFFKNLCPKKDRFKFTADILIISNISQIPIGFFIKFLPVYISFLLSTIYLIIATMFAFKINLDNALKKEKFPEFAPTSLANKNIIFLYFFIIISNVCVGLTYQSIGPKFSKFYFLDGFYGFLIYALGLILIKKSASHFKHYYTFYWAIGSIGVSFIIFVSFNNFLPGYLIVNTLINLSSAVLDIFCRCCISDLLSYSKKPILFFGSGIAANILGVLIGELIAIPIGNSKNAEISLLAISTAIVLFILMLFPLLNKSLAPLLNNNVFILDYTFNSSKKFSCSLDSLFKEKNLTKRETEIANILCREGITYKKIAENLYISENTAKTHIKNIYSKFDVKSRAEFMSTVSEFKNSK